ncbi:DUF2683 family protein [Chryseobacterium foetidum]|uniref:DUF2683 family protein n=1 Tax=Chryseobacterium foetidum TaxID=2951057 RepID=UPI0021C619DB|nr:DUF2683 family protein [Chryseobacterium foetidum]
MENLLVIPKNKKQLNLLKSLLEEMKIQFRTEKSESEEISADLKNKIEEARKEKKEGKLISIDSKNLWENI